MYNADQIRRLEQTRESILGPPGKMSDKKARFNKKASGYIGGVAFKRSRHAVPTRNGDRCYGIATTFQEPRSLDAPSAGSKYGDGMDADVRMRKDILEVCHEVRARFEISRHVMSLARRVLGNERPGAGARRVSR